MANDRLYILCRGCARAFAIAKHYSDGWEGETHLGAFFRRHYECWVGADRDVVRIETQFVLVTESEGGEWDLDDAGD